ncbi:unnamed protein product [Calypogeia fissa]
MRLNQGLVRGEAWPVGQNTACGRSARHGAYRVPFRLRARCGDDLGRDITGTLALSR